MFPMIFHSVHAQASLQEYADDANVIGLEPLPRNANDCHCGPGQSTGHGGLLEPDLPDSARMCTVPTQKPLRQHPFLVAGTLVTATAEH
jgi:hypothetical protein